MDIHRTRIILKDMKSQLEEVIVKLNTYTPQQCHDEIIPILEDIEMLEHGLNGASAKPKNDPLSTNPQFTTGMIQGNNADIMKSLMEEAMGLNGANGPLPEPDLAQALQELYQIIIRLDERLSIEARLLPPNPSAEKLENINSIKILLADLKTLSFWLNAKSYDIVEMREDENDEDDKENA